MNKKEEFKEFVKLHPELITYIKSKKTSFQELYEIYDMYGDDPKAWDKFKEEDRSVPLGELTNIVKNINMDNVQKYINNAQKAISVIEELTGKPAANVASTIPKTPRPINKFFGE
jgi:CO dehydrogenase/acetyl-CoA synthase alpha subunit